MLLRKKRKRRRRLQIKKKTIMREKMILRVDQEWPQPIIMWTMMRSKNSFWGRKWKKMNTKGSKSKREYS